MSVMSVPDNGKPISFKIVASKGVAQQIKAEYFHAKARGMSARFKAMLTQITQKLERDARTLGEPLRELSDLQIRHVIVLPVLLEFGVHRHENIVFLRRIMFLAPPDSE